MRTIALLLLALPLCAQTVDRTKEPETPPIPDLKLPPIYETTLPNGLKVILAEDKRLPLVSVRLNFQAGSKFDPAGLEGLASSAASLLTDGTKTRTSRQIAEAVESLGGSLGGNAGSDALTLSGAGLAESLDSLLGLVADVAQNANFPEDEVQLYKQNAKQGLAARRAQASFLAEEKLYQTVYGAHPYGRYAATLASIDKLNRDALAQFRDTYLVPNNAALFVIGRLPAREAMLKTITRHFGGWAKKAVPAQPRVPLPAARRQILLVDRPGSVQADVHVGRIAPVRLDKDYYPLLVNHIVLGYGASSRMFKEIREKNGYAYDAHSEYETRREAAMFKAVTQVRNEVVEPAIKLLLSQLEQLGAERVPADELRNGKNLYSGANLARFETQEALAMNLANMETLGLPFSFIEKSNQNVRSVEPDQMQAAAKRYIAAGDATIVVVGDASKIGEALKKFGEVTISKAN
jgi:zinc protease